MGRKRVYAKKILSVLEKYGRASFTQIKTWIIEEFGWTISDPSLSDNLKFLEKQGLVHREEFPKEDTLRGDILYSLTKKYVAQKIRSTLTSTMNEISPIESHGTNLGMHYSLFMPIFILGSKLGENSDFDLSSLHLAACDRFQFEVEKTISEKFKSKRHNIKLLLGKLIWAEHTMFLKLMEEEERLCADQAFSTFIHKLTSGQIPRSHYLEFFDTMRKELAQGWGISMLVSRHFPKIYKKMLRYKWGLLDNVALYVASEELTNIEDSEEEAIGFLSQADNRKLLSKFLEEVDRISFVLMVSVGCKQIDNSTRLWLLEKFENWTNALIEGDLDSRTWIFKEGLRNIQRFILALKKKRKLPFLKIDGGELWGLNYLHEFHPRGRSLAFYEDIYEMIDKRRKHIVQKGRKEVNTNLLL